MIICTTKDEIIPSRRKNYKTYGISYVNKSGKMATFSLYVEVEPVAYGEWRSSGALQAPREIFI